MATLDFRFLTDYRMSQTCLAAYHPWLLDWFVSVEGMPSLQLQSAQILKESPGCPSAWAASELRSWLPPFKRIMQIALVIPRANRLKPWWVNFILWGAPLGEVLLRGQSGRRWRATKCQNWRKSRRRNARFAAPTCLVSSCWFSCGLAVSMGEAAKPLLFEGFQLWNWRESRRKCSFCCSQVSSRIAGFPAASLCLWGSCKTSPFRRFPSRLSCGFAWQAWHFVTFQPVW